MSHPYQFKDRFFSLILPTFTMKTSSVNWLVIFFFFSGTQTLLIISGYSCRIVCITQIPALHVFLLLTEHVPCFQSVIDIVIVKNKWVLRSRCGYCSSYFNKSCICSTCVLCVYKAFIKKNQKIRPTPLSKHLASHHLIWKS